MDYPLHLVFLQVDGISGDQYSASTIVNLAARAALGLKQLGLKKSDVITFLGHNSSQQFFTAVGALMNNAVINPVDPTMKVRK